MQIDVKFLPATKVWMMYNNAPISVPVYETRVLKNGDVKYYFWHLDFPTPVDKSICTDNTFSVHETKLFETKEALLNSFLETA